MAVMQIVSALQSVSDEVRDIPSVGLFNDGAQAGGEGVPQPAQVVDDRIAVRAEAKNFSESFVKGGESFRVRVDIAYNPNGHVAGHDPDQRASKAEVLTRKESDRSLVDQTLGFPARHTLVDERSHHRTLQGSDRFGSIQWGAGVEEGPLIFKNRTDIAGPRDTGPMRTR